jgi:hypothetical protein
MMAFFRRWNAQSWKRRPPGGLRVVAARGARLARHVLHDGVGALAYERRGYSLGAHAVAGDAASGVGGAATGRGLRP